MPIIHFLFQPSTLILVLFHLLIPKFVEVVQLLIVGSCQICILLFVLLLKFIQFSGFIILFQLLDIDTTSLSLDIVAIPLMVLHLSNFSLKQSFDLLCSRESFAHIILLIIVAIDLNLKWSIILISYISIEYLYHWQKAGKNQHCTQGDLNIFIILQIKTSNSMNHKQRDLNSSALPITPFEQYMKSQSSGRSSRFDPSIPDQKLVFSSSSKKLKTEFSQYRLIYDKLCQLQTKMEQVKEQFAKRKEERRHKNQQKQHNFMKLQKELENMSDAQFSKNYAEILESSSDINKKIVKAKTDKIQVQMVGSSQKQLEFIQQNGQSKSILDGLVISMAESKTHAFEKNPYQPNNTYYVAQVLKGYKDNKSVIWEHVNSSIDVLEKFGKTIIPLREKIKSKMLDLPIKQEYKGKKTVIFDLDETLIHCIENITNQHEVQISITTPKGSIMKVGINIRPGLTEMLEQLYKEFQLIVFTASHRNYANAVIDHIDPENKYIKYRLYREHCSISKSGLYVKDLRIINRDLKNMVLVDNSAHCYAYQVENGIPIIPYFHGKNDFELKMICSYLRKLKDSEDVRVKNRETFKLSRYRDYKALGVEKLVEDLYSSGASQQ